MRPALERGVAKFNVGTALKLAFLAGLREAVARRGRGGDVHEAVGSRSHGDVFEAAKERLTRKVRELIALYGGSGRADA